VRPRVHCCRRADGRDPQFPYGKVSDQDIREAFDRTEQQARGGYCGLTGVCGIVPAVGSVFSIFLGARCGTDREQKIVMETVTQVSQAITDLTGPSCCKAYVRASLSVAAGLFAEKFGVALPVKNRNACLYPCVEASPWLPRGAMPLLSEAVAGHI